MVTFTLEQPTKDSYPNPLIKPPPQLQSQIGLSKEINTTHKISRIEENEPFQGLTNFLTLQNAV